MEHPKIVSGDMTTAFIAEEYPDGFDGVTPDDETARHLAAVAAHIKMLKEERAAQISGALENHRRVVSPDWVVFLGKTTLPVVVETSPEETTVMFEEGEDLEVRSDWTLGDKVFVGEVGDRRMIIKTDFVGAALRMRYRGADMTVVVRPPRHAELAAKMPEKLPPDTSKMLLCPMPGLVVKIDVAVGDDVQEGQSLCTVEAMKMENILRAERKGVVKAIKAEAGDRLAVDDVIIEFE